MDRYHISFVLVDKRPDHFERTQYLGQRWAERYVGVEQIEREVEDFLYLKYNL